MARILTLRRKHNSERTSAGPRDSDVGSPPFHPRQSAHSKALAIVQFAVRLVLDGRKPFAHTCRHYMADCRLVPMVSSCNSVASSESIKFTNMYLAYWANGNTSRRIELRNRS